MVYMPRQQGLAGEERSIVYPREPHTVMRNLVQKVEVGCVRLKNPRLHQSRVSQLY